MQRLADEARSVFAAATSRFRPASRPEDDHQPAAGVAAATASANVDMYTSAGQQLTEPESKQNVLIKMSELSVVVRPWNETTEMSELERLVREIKEDTNPKAIVWQASHLEDIGYGMKLLHISCQVADDQVSRSIVEKIEALTDYVQSCDILNCSKAPELTPKPEPKAAQLELVKPLPAGTRVAVAGYGRGACVSCKRQFGKLEHTIKFDDGTTVAMKLRNESWMVLRPTAVLSNSSGGETTGQSLTDQTPGMQQSTGGTLISQATRQANRAARRPISPRLLMPGSRRGSFTVTGNEWVEGYHGTTVENALKIIETGFRPSTQGMLGPGVYWSDDVAKTRPYTRGSGTVLKLIITNGKTKIIDKCGHLSQRSWHAEGYDSAYVPPNTAPATGWIKSGLSENCTHDPSRIMVVAVSSDFGKTFPEKPQQFCTRHHVQSGFWSKQAQERHKREWMKWKTKSLEHHICNATSRAERVLQWATECVLASEEARAPPKLKRDIRESASQGVTQLLVLEERRNWAVFKPQFLFINPDECPANVREVLNYLQVNSEEHARLLDLLQQVQAAEAKAVVAVASRRARAEAWYDIVKSQKRDRRRNRKRDRAAKTRIVRKTDVARQKSQIGRQHCHGRRSHQASRRTTARPRSNFNMSSKCGRRH